MTDHKKSDPCPSGLSSAPFETYRRIVQQVPGSIYLKDCNGVYLDCNEFQLKIAGFQDLSQILGKTDAQLPWKESASVLHATDQRVMNSGMPEILLEKAILEAGETIVMLTHKAPLRDEDGSIIGLIGTSLDITAYEQEKADLAQAQRAHYEEAWKTILVFAGSLAHDLRTPLMSMEILNESFLATTSQMRQALRANDTLLLEDLLNKFDTIGSSSDRMLKLVDSLITQNLKVLRDSAVPDVLQRDFMICESDQGMNELLMLYPFKGNQRERIFYDETYPFKFCGNPLMFVRILFNLVSNALHQIEEKGQGEIYISAQARGAYNILSFKETAGGVSESDLQHLFKGYVSTKIGGTGVGLAFCKATMEAFEGQIHAELVEGDCLVFSLLFPRL